VHHPTWVSNANHNNLIAVARHSGGTTTWVVAAHTFNATGKDVYGLFGTQVIGHLVGQDAAATVAGPSLGSPMMDSVGNLYFTARVLLNGASFFDNALVRAVYDAASFSYKLELVLIEGDVVTGGNSGVNYKIRSLSVSNGNSSDPSTTWSHSINQDAFNLANPSLLDGASTQTIGGIVVNANIIYDVDNNGSYDTLFSTPGSPDQDYNVLLYVTSADDCNQNGVPDDLDVADGTSQDQDGNGIPDECAGGVVGTAFCFGDGSGSFCPCGNNGNAGEGCANSTGVGAILFGTGSDSVSADDLVFNAQQLRTSATPRFNLPANCSAHRSDDALASPRGSSPNENLISDHTLIEGKAGQFNAELRRSGDSRRNHCSCNVLPLGPLFKVPWAALDQFFDIHPPLSNKSSFPSSAMLRASATPRFNLPTNSWIHQPSRFTQSSPIAIVAFG
ncbi:MAG: hypothetical protein KDA71_00765, partial [Planctomycetales bacterium]|nr:hypothetical protein [Planctomycetales bacterium]